MKRIATYGMVAIIMLCFSTRSWSQDKTLPPAADRATKITDWMKANLELTDEQVPKVQDINLKYANKMDELQNSSAGRREKLMALKSDDAAKDRELKEVLTDSQYQTYLSKKDELKRKAKAKMKEKRQAG